MTHAFQFGKRQSWKPDLSSNRKADETALFLVYRLYLRPNAVPSRWDSVRAPRDFSLGGQTQPSGQAGPLRTNPGRTDRRGWGGAGAGARASSKETRPGKLEEPLPAFPDRNLSHPRELTPSSKREPLHPQAEVAQPIVGRSGQGPRMQGTGFQPRLREEESPA